MSSDSSNCQRSKGLIKKRDYPQINELIQESKNKKSNINLHPSDVSIAEIKALIRNPKQFMWVYGVELGYHLPPKAYVTWPFIISVLQGKTKLIKSKTLSLTITDHMIK